MNNHKIVDGGDCLCCENLDVASGTCPYFPDADAMEMRDEVRDCEHYEDCEELWK